MFHVKHWHVWSTGGASRTVAAEMISTNLFDEIREHLSSSRGWSCRFYAGATSSQAPVREDLNRASRTLMLATASSTGYGTGRPPNRQRETASPWQVYWSTGEISMTSSGTGPGYSPPPMKSRQTRSGSMTNGNSARSHASVPRIARL